jgi:hypothetical protein
VGTSNVLGIAQVVVVNKVIRCILQIDAPSNTPIGILLLPVAVQQCTKLLRLTALQGVRDLLRVVEVQSRLGPREELLVLPGVVGRRDRQPLPSSILLGDL